MAKSGQARVLSQQEKLFLFDAISKNRHPEKNRAIMQISFKLGLRAQEIALLRIREVAQLLDSGRDFKILEIMPLPAMFTKGSDALGRSSQVYHRKTVSFTVQRFAEVIKAVERATKAGETIDPEEFYPPLAKRKGKSRDLPLVDPELRDALVEYVRLRIDKSGSLKPNDPLFITQKGGPYSPNTLQEHMALMLKNWAGVEKASSHSGRRTLITDVIHKQKKSVKIAQVIAGHASPSTTIIYEEPPEGMIIEALTNLDNEDKD